MRRILVAGVLAFAVFAAMSGTAAAQGFGVFEQGTCMMGRAAAGVAAPCDDGSAGFYNPAALALDRTRALTVGGVEVGPRGGFDTFSGQRLSDMSPNWIPVPGIHFAMPVGKKAAVGLSVMAPYGLTTEWPTSFEGRFTAYETTLKSPMIQPTFAYAFSDTVSFGIGLDVTLNMVELNQRLDLSTQQLAPGITFAQIGVPKYTDFADFNIKGDTKTFGFNLGFLVKPKESPVSFGARYMSRQIVKLDDLELTSTQINTNLRTAVPLPGIPVGTPIDAPARAAVRRRWTSGRPDGGDRDPVARAADLRRRHPAGREVAPRVGPAVGELEPLRVARLQDLQRARREDQQAVRRHGRAALRCRVPGH